MLWQAALLLPHPILTLLYLLAIRAERVQPSFAPVVALVVLPILSSLVVLRGRGVRAWLDVRRELRAASYDVAVDFQGLLKSAALARLSGARSQ